MQSSQGRDMLLSYILFGGVSSGDQKESEKEGFE
jgi:hypothetical protein